MPAPKGNQYGKKPENELLQDGMYVPMTPEMKETIRRLSRKANIPMAEWVRKVVQLRVAR